METREDKTKKINDEPEKLNDEELENVAGGLICFSISPVVNQKDDPQKMQSNGLIAILRKE